MIDNHRVNRAPLGIAASLILVLTSCNSGSVSLKAKTTASAPVETSPSTAPVAKPSAGALLTIKGAPGPVRWTATQNVVADGSAVLTMSGFPNIDESPYFSPSELVGSPGQTVRLQITNQGLIEFTHNFSLNSQSIDLDIPWHRSINETVVFPTSGAVFFFCKYHNSVGQVGVLRASPSP